MICEGERTEGDAKATPSDAKHSVPNIKEITIIMILVIGKLKDIPATIMTIEVMINPQSAPATTSPKIIVCMLTGKESNRSYVPACFSQGVINGPTDEDVKNKAIARKPGKKSDISIFRPI